MGSYSTYPVYDAATLEQLQHLIDEGDSSFLSELFQSYLETAEENINTLRYDENQEVLRRAAHTLKGSSLNVGAVCVADVCKQLESDLRDAMIENMPDRIQLLEAQLERVKASYQGKIQELTLLVS